MFVIIVNIGAGPVLYIVQRKHFLKVEGNHFWKAYVVSGCRTKSKHLKACLGPAFVTVFIREGPPWHSVRHGFSSERAPQALRSSRFFIREGLPWQSVRHKYSSERATLQAERRKRETRREKCTHKNCTLRTIHLGPAGRSPALGLVKSNKGSSFCIAPTLFILMHKSNWFIATKCEPILAFHFSSQAIMLI